MSCIKKNGHLENALHFIGHDSIPCVKVKAEQNKSFKSLLGRVSGH